jgi:hypothetical protein
MEKKKCEATTLNGTPCGMYALTDSVYCYEHEPSLENERKEMKVYGGRKRQYLKIAGGQMFELQNLESVQSGLEETINSLRSMDASVSQCKALLMAYVACLKLFEIKDYDERIKRLEELEYEQE